MSSQQQPKILSNAVVEITIPCWDAECENLYRTFLQSPEGNDSNRAATALLLRLDKKRRDRWSEAIQTIDFSHSSRKAWSILNNLTGRSHHSPRRCAVSANAIASQLIRNGTYEDIDRELSRLISQEMSDLWRATPTSPANISESFTSQAFAATLKHLKLGKAPGSDSICPELITHAGAALKSWVCDLLSSCLRHIKIPRVFCLVYLSFIHKKANCITMFWTVCPHSLGSCYYRAVCATCLPHHGLEKEHW